jgi:non-ribosomal peptide synthetase component F
MRVLQVISTSFDPHVVDICATLTSGGCLVLPKPGGHTDPAYIAQLIKQEQVTHVLGCVASLSREYLGALGRYNGMVQWTMGGENLATPLVNAMQQVSTAGQG